MNKLILGAAIFSFSLLANAQSASVSVSTNKDQVAATENVNITAEKPAVVAKTDCITETGSRIKRKDKKGCNGLAGRSYDSDDISRTGATDIGDALRMLDPSISR
ncbi:MAG: hypothetical protein ACRERV_10075 [Methylococcales bacterium]